MKKIKDLNALSLFFLHEKKAKIPLKKRIKKLLLSPVDNTIVSVPIEIIELNIENLLNLNVIKAIKVQLISL